MVKGGDRLRLEVICPGPNTKALVAWVNPQLIPLDDCEMEKKLAKCSSESWGKSPFLLASTLLEISGSMSENSIKAMHLSCGERDGDAVIAHDIAKLVPNMTKGRQFACLSVPYILLVRMIFDVRALWRLKRDSLSLSLPLSCRLHHAHKTCMYHTHTHTHTTHSIGTG